jgi:hypothetical protein
MGHTFSAYFSLTISALGLLLLVGCQNDDGVNLPAEYPPSTFDGSLQWVKSFGGSGIDQAAGVVVSGDGNYMIVGSTYSNDGDLLGLKTTTDADYCLIKMGADGAVLWTRVYGGPEDEIATGITKTSDGGYVLSGYSRSDNCFAGSNGGFHDYYLLKVDAQGNEVWCQNFGYPGSDQAQSIIQTAQGDLLTTGFFDVSASEGQGDEDRSNIGNAHGVGEYWAIKLDAQGAFFWKRFYGGSNNDRCYNAIQTSDGGYILVGSSESEDFDISDSKGTYDYWAVKLDPQGELVWSRSYGGSEIDSAYDIVPTQDGNYLIIGDARSQDQQVSNNYGNADMWLIKISPQGNLIWEKSLGGSQFDSGKALFMMEDGNYFITGSSRSQDGDVANNLGQNDAWSLVVSPDGTLLYETVVGGSQLDFSEAAAQNGNAILVVGNTESNDGDVLQNQGFKDFLIYLIQ